MKYPRERKLFTVKEAAHACGISRATLLRIEESGFLKPFRIDPDTGYRYYDADNIAAIGQYQMLQMLGLSRQEISDFYYERIDVISFLKSQKKKLAQLLHFVDNLEIRYDHSRQFTGSFIDLPELVCYCDEIEDSAEKSATEAYELFGKCVQEGYRLAGKEPLFLIRDDDCRTPFPTGNGGKMTVCIPVDMSPGSDPHLRTFPPSHVFFMTAYGEPSIIPELHARFWREMDERGLSPAGPARMIGLIAPYTGAHFKLSEFCHELAVPIKEKGIP